MVDKIAETLSTNIYLYQKAVQLGVTNGRLLVLHRQTDMPKDQWKKEKERQEANRRRSQQPSGGLSRKAQTVIRKRLAKANDPILFFGKYQGKRFSQVPQDYLHWLCRTFKDKQDLSPRMDGLVDNLKKRFST